MPIVTNPTAGDVHVNTPLTNFSQKFLINPNAFVSLRAMPNSPVAKQSDLYYNFNRADFLRDSAKERADGTESAGGGFKLSTDPYFARTYAWHKDVTDRQRANQDAPVRLDQSATQWVSQILMIRRERLFQDAYFKAGIWETDLTGIPSGTPTASQFLQWDVSTSDPIMDVRAGAKLIQSQTAIRPNKMLIGRGAYDALLDNDSILSRIIGGATTNLPANVMKTLLAQLFELDEIFVMDAVYNSQVEDLTDPEAATYEFVGDKDALLYYAPNSVGLDEPTAGVQFSWTGLMGNTSNGMRIKRFRVEVNEADRIEGQMSFDYRLTSPALGYFFSGAIA